MKAYFDHRKPHERSTLLHTLMKAYFDRRNFDCVNQPHAELSFFQQQAWFDLGKELSLQTRFPTTSSKFVGILMQCNPAISNSQGEQKKFEMAGVRDDRSVKKCLKKY